jgi:hypothetical protein
MMKLRINWQVADSKAKHPPGMKAIPLCLAILKSRLSRISSPMFFEALSRLGASLRCKKEAAGSLISCKLIGTSGLDSVSPRLGGR